MTLTQRAPWAEFIWTKCLYEKKTSWLSWHLYRRLHGQNSYGRTFTWRKKNTAPPMLTQKALWAEFLWAKRSHDKNPWLLTQKTPWAEFLWARRLHKKKNPGSHDINKEDSMGRIPMGETLTWRKSLTLMTLTQKTPWAEFLWAKRSLEENPLLYWHQHEDSMGGIPMGERSHEEKPRLHRC